MTERAEEYQFYKSLKICVRCHKNQAEPNRVMCLECSGAESDRMKEKRKYSDADKLKKKDMDKYYKLKQQGICTYCKHEKALQGRTKCQKCLSKIRNKRNSKKCDIARSERVSYGLCYICGNDVLYKDTHVCEKCYKTRYESISKIMHKKEKNNFWKQDNNVVFRKI